MTESTLPQRVGEQYVIRSDHTKAKNLEKSTGEAGPDTGTASYFEQEEYRELCADEWGGTLVMRKSAEKKKYLPRWEGEDKRKEWIPRRDAAVFTNFFRRTVEGLVDQPFSKDLELDVSELTDEEAERVEAFAENVDRRGSTITQFGRAIAERSLALGRTGILVDFPLRDSEPESRAQEEREGLMPFFQEIPPRCLFAAHLDEIDGQELLDEARYTWSRAERDGWAEVHIPQIIALNRAAGDSSFRRVFEQDGDGNWIEDKDQAAPFRGPARFAREFLEIPLVDVPTGTNCPFHSLPKLRDLAEMNLLHFQKKSNFDTAVAVAGSPMHAFIGFDEDDLKGQQWGALRYVATTKTEASVQELSFSFASAQTSIADLDKLEKYMALASLEPAMNRATGEEKSTIRMLDEAKKVSRLQAWALGWLQGLQGALDWAQLWMGIEPRARLAFMDEVFESLSIQPDPRLLVDMKLQGAPIPWRVIFEEQQRMGGLSDHYDIVEMIEEGSTEALAA